jgi:outer membrane protein assembly factor BamD
MHVRRILWPVAALALLFACASHGPALDAMDADTLFAHATERMQAGKWSDAETAFQRFLILFPSHPRAAEARFRMGETFVARKDYITAAVEFNRLAGEYPSGPFADDARFKVCEAYYHLSPRPPLYQEYTLSAIEHCNSLASYYPDSEFAARAKAMVVELTDKLAEKEYNTGNDYFRKGIYHSANISYDRVIADFPQSVWAPRALLRLYQSYQKLKYDQEAAATRERLIRDYPNSPEAKQLSGDAAQP